MRRAVQWFDRLAAQRVLAILLPGVLIIVLRLAQLPWNPVPDPMAPDEFSQLLAARTFASGRLTNPTPPFPVHFEAPYVLLEPTYASKYPVGPPLLMALGIVAAGSAWAGVLLGAGLMCSSFCWMLQGWVPYRWALAGSLLAVGRYSLHHYWLNSYWGGCMAALGGAVVLGALPRILRGGSMGPAFAMGAGLVVLAVSRPYEGLLFSIVPVSVVALQFLRWPLRRSAAVALPIAALVVPLVAVHAYYNWRVTGSPSTLPYAAYTAQYEPTPHFFWQTRRQVAPFVHREMEAYLSFPGVIEEQRSVRAVAVRSLETIGIALPNTRRMAAHPAIFSGLVFGLALIVSTAFAARDRSMRIPLFALVIFVLGLLPETFFFQHYAAPAAGLMLLIVVQGLRHASVLGCWRRSVGRALPAALSAGSIIAVVVYAWFLLPFSTHPPQYITIDRPRVAAHVSKHPGKHLLLVRFGSRFSIHHGEWIYNEPDIGSAKLLWARDMGPELNRAMIEHFRDRQVWHVYKDTGPARVYRAGTSFDPALDASPPAVTALLRYKE